MSAAEIIEKIRPLPTEEKRELVEQILSEFGTELGWVDSELTPEQLAELDRRAEDALAHPERCRPLDEVLADIEAVPREAVTAEIVIVAVHHGRRGPEQLRPRLK